MAKVHFTFGKDGEGNRQVNEASLELPDGSKIEVRREGDSISIDAESDSDLIRSVVQFLDDNGGLGGLLGGMNGID